MADEIIEKITSCTNSQVKETVKLAQKKYRTLNKKFLIEGIKPTESAIAYGYEIEKVFVLDTKVEKYSHLPCKIISATPEVMKKISTTENYPEIVAIASFKEISKDLFKNFKKVILLENIKDAGNLGTIIRSATAFGCDGIVLVGDTVDLYNPKVVRSSVGTLFMLPIIELQSITDIKDLFSAHKIYATKLHKNNVIKPKQIDVSKPIVIMFGSEANGLTDELSSLTDEFVIIEHNNNVESLNLGIAASIIIYEISEY